MSAPARRAAHLQAFVERYRSVSQPPPPTLADVPLGTLLLAVQRLVEPAWAARYAMPSGPGAGPVSR